MVGELVSFHHFLCKYLTLLSIFSPHFLSCCISYHTPVPPVSLPLYSLGSDFSLPILASLSLISLLLHHISTSSSYLLISLLLHHISTSSSYFLIFLLHHISTSSSYLQEGDKGQGSEGREGEVRIKRVQCSRNVCMSWRLVGKLRNSSPPSIYTDSCHGSQLIILPLPLSCNPQSYV